MGAIAQDIRFGLRLLLKSPGFTIVAALSLALGIGVNTTVFNWIDAILLRPLPGVANGAELAAFETVTPNGEFITNSYPDYRDYRDHLKLISGLAAAQPAALGLGDEDRLERVWGELVSGNYFAVLGVKPLAGRVFLPEEYGDKPGAFPVAVISERLWHSRFQSDPAIAGRTIRVNRHELTVVGVVPSAFRGSIPGLTFDIWAPLVMGPQLNGIGDWMLRDRKTRNLIAIVRLKPGVTLEQGRAEASAIARELARMDPYTNGGIGATMMPLGEGHFGAQSMLRGPLHMLMAVCAVVLLIVCANVANLLLARTVARRREFSLRLALGAGRGRIARQVITESLMLAAVGTALGVALASLLGDSLGYLLPPTAFPIEIELRLSGSGIAFAALICIGTAILSGLAPAMHSSRGDIAVELKDGGRGVGGGVRTNRTRTLLVVGEVALAVVALAGAALFARSFQAGRKSHPGFDSANVLLSHFYLSTSGYSVDARKQFCRRLRAELEAAPGVTSVAYADHVPLGFTSAWWEDLQIEGYTPRTSENMKIFRAVAAPGYLGLMRIPLLDGRDFREDDDEKALPVMIVNQTFARRFFAGGNPIGRKVRGWGRWFTIIGVARDSKYNNVAEAPLPFFYVPFQQVYRADMGIAFYLRTAGDPRLAVSPLRAALRKIDPGVGVFGTMPLAEYTVASLYPQKVAAVLLGVLGALALVLATIGLYSVMAYMVGQRTHEMGIRMALGARPGHVLSMVIGNGMLLAGAGIAVGITAALAFGRFVRGLLVGVAPADPASFIAAALILAGVAALASYLPARRATRVDPIQALRHE